MSDDLPDWLTKPHIVIGLIVLTFVLWCVASNWRLHYGIQARRDKVIMAQTLEIRARRAAEEAKRQAQAEAREQAQPRLREELLKDFTLQHAPAAWRTLQALRAEAQTQREQLEAFKADMRIFGLQVSTDENVQQLQAQLAETERRRDGLYEKLVEALLAERKAAAAIGRRGYERLRQRALEEGERRAEEAQRAFQGSRAQGVPAQ